MRVYLVQHGESKSEEEDPQRRLTDKGIGEVQNVADFCVHWSLRSMLIPEIGKVLEVAQALDAIYEHARND